MLCAETHCDTRKQVRAGIEMLYDILTDANIEHIKGLIIACNKSDLTGQAVKPDKVKASINKELDRLRTTRGTIGTHGIHDTSIYHHHHRMLRTYT